MRIKNDLKLKPYKVLEDSWTRIANTMFWHIDNGNAYKIYCYLCYRYNKEFEYSFPSIDTISKDCLMSEKTVRTAIKYLEERRFVVKFKKKGSGSKYYNNCYYINYVVDSKSPTQIEQEIIAENLNNSIEADELGFFIDEEGYINFKEDKEKIDNVIEIEDKINEK